jgi:hypothetical protein
MLLTLLIVQALMTLILNQTYQAMVAQFEAQRPEFPVHPQDEIRACLQSHCSEKVRSFSKQSLTSHSERQFYNAVLTLCEHGKCWEISQVFSENSAILKREQYYYAIRVDCET